MLRIEPGDDTAGVPPPRMPGELLGRYVEMVSNGVRRELTTEPRSEFGDLLADYPSRPGKGLRPALLLASCEAFGGDVRDALPAAVSLELIHNAFLVHDDVEDGSVRRRGAPALHVQHGVPLAVHTGDALAVRAVRPLLEQSRLGTHLAQRVVREFLDAVGRTLEGQAMELAWRTDATRAVSLDDYLRLVLHKSCWYTTIYPLRAGCVIGSRGAAPLAALTRFAFLLGAAFQVRDDILDLTGDPETHGKEARADLREGKRTLVLVHLLGAARSDDRLLVERFLALSPDRRGPEEIDRVLDLIRRHGSIEAASAWADALVAGARVAFAPAFEHAVSPFHTRFIEELIDFVVVRAR